MSPAAGPIVVWAAVQVRSGSSPGTALCFPRSVTSGKALDLLSAPAERARGGPAKGGHRCGRVVGLQRVGTGVGAWWPCKRWAHVWARGGLAKGGHRLGCKLNV